MPGSTPVSKGLQALLEEQKKATQRLRTQHQQDVARQQQQWRKEDQARRQQQQYEQAMVRLGHHHAREDLRRQQRSQLAQTRSLAGMGLVSRSMIAALEAQQHKQQQQQRREQLEERHALRTYRGKKERAKQQQKEERERALRARQGEEQLGLAEQHWQARADVRDKRREEQKQADRERRETALHHKERSRAWHQVGLSALAGNAGGMSEGMAALAMGGGPAALAAAGYAAIAAGAGKAAQVFEILNNSTLNAAQANDKLAAAIIPVMQKFIELRRSLNGVNDALRRMHIAAHFAQARQAGQAEINRAELARAAEIGLHGARGIAFGNYARQLASHPPAVMPRGTLAEEIAFQNRQAILPHQYAKGWAQAEANAAKRALEESQRRLAGLEREQRQLVKARGSYIDEALPVGKVERSVAGIHRTFDFAQGTGAMGKLHHAVRTAQLDFRPPFFNDADKHQLDINKADLAAARAIEAVDQNRLRIEDEVRRQKQLQLTLAEKEAQVRKAAIRMEQAKLDNLGRKEQRSTSMAWKIGSMPVWQQGLALQSLKIAQRTIKKGGNLSALPPFMRQHVEALMPQWAQKQYEKSAPKTALWKEMEKMGGKDFISKDFAGMRNEMQQLQAKIEVKFVLNEEQMSQKIARQVGPILDKLIEQIVVKLENKIQHIQVGQQMRNANQ